MVLPLLSAQETIVLFLVTLILIIGKSLNAILANSLFGKLPSGNRWKYSLKKETNVIR